MEPPDDQKRITLIRMLPVDVGAYISMHWGLPEYSIFKKLRDLIFKYVKVLRNLRRSTAKLLLNPAKQGGSMGVNECRDLHAKDGAVLLE